MGGRGWFSNKAREEMAGFLDTQESLLSSSWQAITLTPASLCDISSTLGQGIPSPGDTAVGTGDKAPTSPTQPLVEHIQHAQHGNLVEKCVLSPLAVGRRMFPGFLHVTWVIPREHSMLARLGASSWGREAAGT